MSNTINKVVYDGNTLIDITDTTATDSDVANGIVYYRADGTRGVGTLTIPTPNIMTVYLKADFTISATNTTYDLTNVETLTNVGTKLSLVSGKIKIGAGVSKVKVSYTAKCLSPANTTRTFMYLMYNHSNTDVAISQEGAWFGGTNWQVNIGVVPRVLSVSEGDTFWLRCYGYKNNTIGGKAGDFIPTILTVEVVE